MAGWDVPWLRGADKERKRVVSRRAGEDPGELEFYEGVIFTTAQLVLEDRPEMELDDVRQRLRWTAWKALEAYSEARRGPQRQTVERFVFMCLRNKVKDLLDLRRRHHLSLEAMAATDYDSGRQSLDRIEFRAGHYEGHDEVYGRVEDDDLTIPNTLTVLEGQSLALLCLSYGQSETARTLGIGKRDMERVMRALRAKLADWRPGAGPPDIDENVDAPERKAA